MYNALRRYPTPPREFVGISYLAFRTSHLVLEVRNGVVPRPSFSQYLGFAFFVCTLSVGPISPFSHLPMAFEEDGRPDNPARAVRRCVYWSAR